MFRTNRKNISSVSESSVPFCCTSTLVKKLAVLKIFFYKGSEKKVSLLSAVAVLTKKNSPVKTSDDHIGYVFHTTNLFSVKTTLDKV